MWKNHVIMVPQSNIVEARKEPLNHVLRFDFQWNAHVIMVPGSNGVEARKEPLNHEFQFYSEGNIHDIMNALILQLRCKETFIESCATILKSEECTWYNSRKTRLTR